MRRDGDLATPSSVPPKVLKSVGRHFAVPDRVLSFPSIAAGPRAFIGELELQASVEPFGGPTQQELYAKTLPKCRVESAMNSMLAHCKNAVCDKSC